MTGVTADVPQALVLLSLRQGQLHTPGLEITDLKGASCRWAVSLCRAVNNCLAGDSTGQLPMPGDICHCSGFHSQQEVHCMVDASRAEAGVNLTQDFTGLLSSRQWQVLGRSARAHLLPLCCMWP